MTGGAIFFQIAAIEGLRAGADLAIEIFEQIVVFAQATVEVLLGEGCFAVVLVVLVVIIVGAIGVVERLEVIIVNIMVQLSNLAVVCVAALSKGLITKKMTKR